MDIDFESILASAGKDAVKIVAASEVKKLARSVMTEYIKTHREEIREALAELIAKEFKRILPRLAQEAADGLSLSPY